MQMLQVYNASEKTQYIPGIASCAAGARVQAYVPQSVFDDLFPVLYTKAPLTGVAVMDPTNMFTYPPILGFWTGVQARASSAGAILATTRMQVGVTTTVGYTLTLPTAVSVAAGETIYVFNDATVGGYTLTVAPNGTNTIEGTATLTRSAVVFAALSGIPSTVTVALVESAGTPNGIHSIVEVAGVSTIINANFASGQVSAQEIVDAITAGTGVTVVFAGSVNVSATTAAPATVVAAAAAAPLVPGTVALTAAANTLRFVSDGVSNWATY